MTTGAPTTIPAGTTYAEAEAMARRMSDSDLLKVARGLACAQCHNPEMAANHEVNRRFERLRERFVHLNRSMASLLDKYEALQERFDALAGASQRALAVLTARGVRPGEPAPNRE